LIYLLDRSRLRYAGPLQVQAGHAPRVRRPIIGLVRDNYPPGLAATYRFIPKQTTAVL